MTQEILFEHVIPAKNSLGFTIKEGQFLRIIDIFGKQVGDLALFNENNLKEKLSTSYTKQHVRGGQLPKYWLASRVGEGAELVSTIHNPMMTIVRDTPVPKRVHDLSLRMCSTYIHQLYGRPGPGCLELLAEALKKWGISIEEVPDCLNVFMNTYVENGKWYIDEPVSKPGDYLELRAEMDLVAAQTACPADFGLVNAGKCKPLKVQIIQR